MGLSLIYKELFLLLKLATQKNLRFQDALSPLIEQLIFFHDYSMLILVLITTIVAYLIIIINFNKLSNRFLISGQITEIIWTITPAIILICIAIPSIRLLYLIDETSRSSISIKAIGHQWYWSYEYTEFNIIEFDSYIIPQIRLNPSEFRLLDVDNRLILPINIKIRIIITATDVIHSWTIPSLGVKTDATPGRLNQTTFKINRPGLFFGQCSEICGSNHRFIPITIERVNLKTFIKWIKNFN
jgi:cytochrome c oxidase subunit 2